MSAAGAFDEPGNIGDHIAILIWRLARGYDAKVRFKSSEGIVGDLWTGRGDARNQSRFSGIGISHQTNIGQQLQLESIMALLARTSQLMLARCLVRRCSEVLIATSPAPTGRDHQALVGTREIMNALARVCV